MIPPHTGSHIEAAAIPTCRTARDRDGRDVAGIRGGSRRMLAGFDYRSTTSVAKRSILWAKQR